MHVSVSKIDGKRIDLEVESGTTICEVKRMIEDNDVDLKGRLDTLLIFAGKPLISCNPTPPCARKCGTLGDYGVQDGCNFDLRIRLNTFV